MNGVDKIVCMHCYLIATAHISLICNGYFEVPFQIVDFVIIINYYLRAIMGKVSWSCTQRFFYTINGCEQFLQHQHLKSRSVWHRKPIRIRRLDPPKPKHGLEVTRETLRLLKNRDTVTLKKIVHVYSEIYTWEWAGIPFQKREYMSPVKRICVFEHSVMTNFNYACPAIQRGQGSGFLSEGSS